MFFKGTDPLTHIANNSSDYSQEEYSQIRLVFYSLPVSFLHSFSAWTMKINAAAFLFLSSEFEYQVNRGAVFVLRQTFGLELLQKLTTLWELFALGLCGGKKKPNHHPFLFNFSLFLFKQSKNLSAK